MKNLISIREELKPYTYDKAADILKSMGHVKRASRLKDWGEHVRTSNYNKAKLDNRNKLKENGSFKMDVISGKEIIMTGDFYIDMSIDSSSIADYFIENCISDGDIKDNSRFYIFLQMGFIPTEDYEDFYDLENYFDKWMIYDGVYWNTDLDLQIKVKDGKLEPTGEYSFDSRDSLYFMFHNRKEAFKFKKLLSGSLEGKNEFGYSNTLKDDLLDIFLNKTGYTKLPTELFNQDSFDRICKSIKTLSLNKLYID